MKNNNFEIKDLFVLSPKIFKDERGYFFESYNKKKFSLSVFDNVNFVQDNESYSKKNVLRGLHFQKHPKSQGKLVRVVKGEVYDVCVDLRRNSYSFGKWFGIKLSEKNKKQIWIPPGFAHGFLTLSKDAILSYKTTEYYEPSYEECLIWNDPTLSIDWPIKNNLIISNKDCQGILFEKYIKDLG